MSLPNNDRRTTITATAGQTVFTPDFTLFAANEIRVRFTPIATGTEVVLTGGGTDYTINESGSTYPKSFTITKTVAAALNDVLIIEGARPERSESAFTTGGDFTAGNVNRRIDEAGAERQEIRRDLTDVTNAVDSLIGTIGEEIVTGSLTAGYIPLADGTASLTNSVVQQSGGDITVGGAITTTGNIVSAAIIGSVGDDPQINLIDSDAGTDVKVWNLWVDGGTFRLRLWNDLLNLAAPALSYTRSGITPGALTVHGVLAAGSGPVVLTNAGGRLLIAALDPTGASQDDIVFYNAGAGAWQRGTVTDIQVDLATDVTGQLDNSNLPDNISVASVTTTGNLISGAIIGAVGNDPQINLIDTNAGADVKTWNLWVDAGTWRLRCFDDALSTNSNALSYTRTGITPGTFTVHGATQFVGNMGNHAAPAEALDFQLNAALTAQYYAANSFVTLRGQRSNGTIASPTAVVDNDVIMFLAGRGYHSTGTPGFSNVAYIALRVDGSPSGNFVPGDIGFFTGTDAASPVERMTIRSSGAVQMLRAFGLPPSTVTRTVTLATGAITVTDADFYIVLAAQTGTTDDFGAISGGYDGQRIIVLADAGDTITLQPAGATGEATNLLVNTLTAQTITGLKMYHLQRIASSWQVLNHD